MMGTNMRHLHQCRSYLPDRTVCLVKEGDTNLFVGLELPDKKNMQNVSCIPEGHYRVKRDKTGKHQFYSIQGVTNRTFIEIHPASKPSHLLGCSAYGLSFTPEYNLIDSEKACLYLIDEMGDEDFLLTIRKFDPEKDSWE